MKLLHSRYGYVILLLAFACSGLVVTSVRAQQKLAPQGSAQLDSEGVYVATVSAEAGGALAATRGRVRVVSLEQALSVLAERHGVSFLYQEETVEGKQVVLTGIAEDDLAVQLARIAESHALYVAAIGERSYVVRGAGRSVTPLNVQGPEVEVGSKLTTHTPLMLQSIQVQTGVIAGTVTDSTTGEPLPGVNVVIAGMQQGAATDAEGRFAISELEAGTYDLLASFIGYATKRINGIAVTAGDTTVVNIALHSSTEALDEVVVIGYGTTSKTSLTSAISKVENEKLAQMPVGSAASALVGRMAGINISQTRGRPGSSPTITIRGPGSISASNDPLIVIDGVPGGSLDNINIYNVESIEVLKDASAAAIYGSRGAGGVILVTTKKGSVGQAPQVNFNAYYGVGYPIKYNDWVSGGEAFYDYQALYINRDFAYAGGDPSLPLWGDPRRPKEYRVNPAIAEGNWNWEDILLHPAPIQNYNLSVRGGTDNTTYYVAATLKDEQGHFVNAGYRQYLFRANVKVDISPTVSAGFRLSPNYSKTRTRPAGIRNLIKMPPFLSPERQEDGTYPQPRDYWAYSVSGGVNPLATLEGTYYYSSSFNNLAQIYVTAKITDGLSIRSSIASDMTFNNTDNFQEASATANSTNSGYASSFRNINIINENILRYDNVLKDVHSLTGILGASYQYNTSRFASISAVPGSFANETIRTLNNAIAQPSSGTSKAHWGLASYFTRVKYGFDNKYLLSASIRTDGSSRFGPDNRWGFFPSASAAWRISEEGFMQEVSVISELKLRASYGVVGNFNIGNFQYLGLIGTTTYAPGGELISGMAQSSLGNPGLKWEKTESYDIGFEIGLFDGRINLVADYYAKNTNDLLYSVTIPSITGFSNTLVNIGDIRNTGIELELNTTNITGNFVWETSFNISRNWNKVASLGGGVDEVINTTGDGMAWILREGEPMFSFYGYRQIGVIETKEELENSPIMKGQVVGTVRYDDVNSDGVITPDDRVILGSFMPDYKMGMVNDFQWKNFDLSIVMEASIGASVYNLENLYYQGPTVSAMRRPLVENQWYSVDRPGNGHSPSTSLKYINYVTNSDYYIEPTDFLSIRNINLGYTLPTSLVNKFHLDNLRVYASMTNVVMLTKEGFHGYNPEGYTQGGISGISSLPGYNLGSEPLSRTVAIGVNVTF